MVENTEDFRLFLFTPPSTDQRIRVVRGDGTVLITDSDGMTKFPNTVTVILSLFQQL